MWERSGGAHGPAASSGSPGSSAPRFASSLPVSWDSCIQQRGHLIIPLPSLCLLGGYGATFTKPLRPSAYRPIVSWPSRAPCNTTWIHSRTRRQSGRPTRVLSSCRTSIQTSLPISVTGSPVQGATFTPSTGCATYRYPPDPSTITWSSLRRMDATTLPEHCRPLEQRTTAALWWCPKSEPTRYPNQ